MVELVPSFSASSKACWLRSRFENTVETRFVFYFCVAGAAQLFVLWLSLCVCVMTHFSTRLFNKVSVVKIKSIHLKSKSGGLVPACVGLSFISFDTCC